MVHKDLAYRTGHKESIFKRCSSTRRMMDQETFEDQVQGPGQRKKNMEEFYEGDSALFSCLPFAFRACARTPRHPLKNRKNPTDPLEYLNPSALFPPSQTTVVAFSAFQQPSRLPE
ncbi:hypothetical protein LSTR_LSTR007386 [Laodelphax striatellus]|uniref:Uncharacterized protein n=1 Tax=Laodelphax striatellus TaxID=195883 RepID=A0A482XPV6_LAOST|nr:hypothetical protein LSTR_LSTR007386 [Laodelphax striatellus]